MGGLDDCIRRQSEVKVDGTGSPTCSCENAEVQTLHFGGLTFLLRLSYFSASALRAVSGMSAYAQWYSVREGLTSAHSMKLSIMSCLSSIE